MTRTRKQATLTVSDILKEDDLAKSIVSRWHNWKSARRVKEQEWQEVRNYLYATDTTTTSAGTLPWRNKTTTPKLTQIKDNLLANYKAALYPKRKWLEWIGGDSVSIDKARNIETYMQYVVSQPHFEETLDRLLEDYVEYGNAFAMPEWWDDSYDDEKRNVTVSGYIGPTAVRISPENIVFDPTSPTFTKSPKIIRTFLSYGDLESTLMAKSHGDENELKRAKDILNYLKEIRQAVSITDVEGFDESYSMDGFSSFREYLLSGNIEILTFYGDIYDTNNNKFYRNKIITVADRHKLISIEDNPTNYTNAPIFQAVWRKRRDNLWGMGPLDNLVGIQYRIDHLENIKADAMDLTVFPPLFVKGIVEDFKWAPFSIIRTSDPSADVRPLGPDTSVINVNLEIQRLMDIMEEMAGAPKEAMGFRTPGEKTAFEVQRLENAASRVFQAKIMQFERMLLEPLLNAMLEMAWRNYGSAVSFVFKDDATKVEDFISLTKEDIMGVGKLRPSAARHFVDNANLVQSITNLKASGLLDDQRISVHFSGKRLAEILAEATGLDDYKVVSDYIAIAEQSEMTKLANIAEEDVAMNTMTPSGLTPDDADMPIDQMSVEDMMMFGGDMLQDEGDLEPPPDEPEPIAR